MPATTGPGGKNGGMHVGTGPVPSTLVTIVVPCHIRKHFSNASQTASKISLWYIAVGSAYCAIIRPFITLADTGAVTWVSAMTGIGTFGCGIATGVGQATNAGYHGRPGILIDAVYASQPLPMTFAIAFV